MSFGVSYLTSLSHIFPSPNYLIELRGSYRLKVQDTQVPGSQEPHRSHYICNTANLTTLAAEQI